MKLQKIISHLQRLHPKEIDLGLSRIKKLCSKIGNLQDNLKCIQIAGTNGKYSTIQAIRSILKEAGINCNIYISPHVKKINERFVYNDIEISDEDLFHLLNEIEEINAGEPITYFEILTAAFFYGCKKYTNNLTLCEFGLFAKFDAVNVLKNNLATIITSIGLDHLDWLPENERNINKIIFEKTSCLLNSKIIVSEQSSNEILNKIIKSISNNPSEKIIFNSQFTYSLNENGFIYYEDKFGGIKLPTPNLKGNFQISNIATAIATVRNIEHLNVNENHIKSGITKIKSIARLQELKEGKLKNLVKNNKIFVDGSHNPLGAEVLSKYLDTLNCNKHMILGMMKNKDHEKYASVFKGKLASLTTINIPHQKNSVNKEDLKNKISKYGFNLQSKNSVYEAITSLELKKDDMIIITGSLYLAGEVLNLN